ncbi:MAG: 16S rRNA (cytosine(1402)-N(4))-methyltransferase RsmH [Muribaculaceae bacterium]|nr:16S rRNA (cytosine(1402)-N(4))-methyltransferase RsmH [Muribaculaceae bacterium]
MQNPTENLIPYHVPALLSEAIDLLNIKPKGIYVDATFGGGGHSRAILEKLGPEGKLFAFDRDIDSYSNIMEDPRFTFVHSNFRFIENFMRFHGVGKIDGVLADFGVSFHHFDTPERGFSFRYDSVLDMRMNRSSARNAAEVVNNASEKDLTEILRNYADLKKTTGVVKALIEARKVNKISTTKELMDVVKPALDPRQEKKELSQVFQALRIAVNHEDEDIKHFLNSVLKVLKVGGRLVTLTYHSMEDRLVKNFMKTGNIDGIEEKDFFGHVNTPWKLLVRRPIEPSREEIERNPRSRSARLRGAELVEKES